MTAKQLTDQDCNFIVDVAQLVRAGDLANSSLKTSATLVFATNNRQMRVQVPTSAPFICYYYSRGLAALINIAAIKKILLGKILKYFLLIF